MAADKIIFTPKGLMAGISPQPQMQQPEPVVTGLTDFRCGGTYERVVLTRDDQLLSSATADTMLYNFLGLPYMAEAHSSCLFADQLVLRNDLGTKLISSDLTESALVLPEPALRFLGLRGAMVYLGYPGPHCIYIEEPAVLPTFTRPAVPSRMVFQLENCSEIKGLVGLDTGIVVFGDQTVAYWNLLETATTPTRQTVLANSGTLSDYSWAGGSLIAYWIGQDRNLWATDGKKAQKLGYGWLFKGIARARLCWIESTNDLFIMTDEGTGSEIVNPKTYLYHGGLSQLSIPLASVAYVSGQLQAIGVDGYLYYISSPMADVGTDYDWSQFIPGPVPNRAPDLVSSYSDYYTAQEKSLSAVEVTAAPQWPAWAEINSDFGGPAAWCQFTKTNPVGELIKAGHQFQISFWFPLSSEAGAYKISSLRVHVQAEDLRGIYAAATGQATFNG